MAYREIINKLRIATEPRSLKKLQKLEKMAAEELAGVCFQFPPAAPKGGSK